jgi:ketosteroid isomerase-like protein
MHQTRNEFAAWLSRYVAAWRSRDGAAIGELFSADASYSFRGGQAVVVGRDEIVKAWLGEDEVGSWEAHYEPLAVEEEVHVAIGWTRYTDTSGDVRDEYSNIFVCRFDDAGRCSSFTEWWMRQRGDGDGDTGDLG